MMRWTRPLLFLAGVLGAIGFLLPFYVFPLDDGGQLDVTGYRLVVGFGDAELDQATLYEDDPDDPEGAVRSPVPYFFLGPALMVVVGLAALLRRRMGRLLGLVGVGAGCCAVMGWIHPRQHLDLAAAGIHNGTGAALLGMSGLLAILVALAVVVWGDAHVSGNLPLARAIR